MSDPIQPPADPGASETKPPVTPPSGDKPADFDAKVLEHPELWKQPRIAELLNDSKELKKLRTEQEKQQEQLLTEQKRFEELATQKGNKVSELEAQVKTMQTDHALTAALIKESVVDLDAALKLIDRSKLSVDDSGKVTGVDEALASLKNDKKYLFSAGTETKPVGSPSNNGTETPGAPMKFKRSQLKQPGFYKEHEKEILEAYKAGLIEDDITPAR